MGKTICIYGGGGGGGGISVQLNILNQEQIRPIFHTGGYTGQTGVHNQELRGFQWMDLPENFCITQV